MAYRAFSWQLSRNGADAIYTTTAICGSMHDTKARSANYSCPLIQTTTGGLFVTKPLYTQRAYNLESETFGTNYLAPAANYKGSGGGGNTLLIIKAVMAVCRTHQKRSD